MLFDTHTHPYITFKKSPDNNLEHFFWENKHNACISIGCDMATSIQSIKLAQKYSWLKATIGFHPCDIPYSIWNKEVFTSLQDNTSLSFFSQKKKMRLQIEQDIRELRNLYFENKEHIVGIWEIWLDYYHLKTLTESSWLSHVTIKEIQEAYFRAQIELSGELWLPFVIHSRETNAEVLEILTHMKAKNYVFHCYSGNWDFAQKILVQNPQAMFGFGWPLTFKKSLELQEVARKLPLERILTETDAPFLTPEPLRWKEENEPSYVWYVLKKLQELREERPEEIEKAVYGNAVRFFKIA